MSVKTDSFVQFQGDPNTKAFTFSFRPNGSSAVTQSTIVGREVASVTRINAGEFDVLLKGTYSGSLTEFDPTVSTSGLSTDLIACPSTYTIGTQSTGAKLKILLKTGSVNTDAASDVQTVVRCRVTFAI